MNNPTPDEVNRSRRDVVIKTGAVVAASIALPALSAVDAASAAPVGSPAHSSAVARQSSGKITTKDGVEIFYKDWGTGQPIVFSHGWPLSADDWDAQMLFFLARGFRVIAHDRRGHGRSAQTADGNDMDHYAADLAALTDALDLHDAIHVGHSTGGGEVARYVARHGQQRTAKIVLIGAVPPIMLKTQSNPDGTPMEVFDSFRKQLLDNRSQLFLDIAKGPFYGYNRAGAKISEGTVHNWWRQGMMGGSKAQYDCIKAFSETDFTDDLKLINQPALVMCGDDDQVVPYKDAGVPAAKLLKTSTLKIYPGFPHGMMTTHPDVINNDILAFIKS
jgi:non-heme chloroperoxidase